MRNELGKKRLSPRWITLIVLAAMMIVIYVLANIPAVAEYVFARGVTRWIDFLLSRITNYIPVSFYEWSAVILIIGGVALAVILIVMLCKKCFSAALTCVYRLSVAALAVALAFGVLYAPLYNRYSTYEALGLSEISVTDDDVYSAAQYYVKRLNETSSVLERDGDGNVVNAYKFSELADRLNEEFAAYGAYFAQYEVRPKRVVLSVPMSYLGITGIYFPFYAEANVNVNIPPSDLPVTMAHEMAHAKGVAQENEANLIAYCICLRADDAFLNYSGLMDAAAILINALPEERAKVLRDSISQEVLEEYKNISEHYEKYECFLDRISSFFNDLFLKSNGIQEGTRSYGNTVCGLVSLYLQEKDIH